MAHLVPYPKTVFGVALKTIKKTHNVMKTFLKHVFGGNIFLIFPEETPVGLSLVPLGVLYTPR